MNPEECGNDYRIWIMAKQKNITCVPMDKLVKKIQAYYKPILRGPGDYMGISVIDLGLTKKAAAAVINHMMNNTIPINPDADRSKRLYFGERIPIESDDPDIAKKYCQALATSKLICFDEG